MVIGCEVILAHVCSGLEVFDCLLGRASNNVRHGLDKALIDEYLTYFNKPVPELTIFKIVVLKTLLKPLDSPEHFLPGLI